MSDLEDIPEPCTARARELGCECYVPAAHSAAIDPPEPCVVDHCPLHGLEANGYDPDYEMEKRREDREFFDQFGSWDD